MKQHLIGAHVYCTENNSIHDLTNEQIDNRHNFIFFFVLKTYEYLVSKTET